MTIIGGALSISLLNPRWVAHLAESKLTDLVGQEVRIDSIDIDLGTVIRLRAENASVANPPWASDPYLASVEIFEVGIDVFELLSGDLVLTDVQLAKPVVHLERGNHGGANWAVGASEEFSSDDQQGSDSRRENDNAFSLPRIESFSIQEGSFSYIESHQNTSLEISVKSGVEQSPTDSLAITVDGGGHFRGEPVQISATAIPPAKQEDVNEYALAVRLNSAETHLSIEGKIDVLVSPEMADLDFHLEGENLSRWNEALGLELPALPTYVLSAHLQLEEGKWSLDPIHATILRSDVTGSLWVIPDANPPQLEGVFSSDRLDVAQLQELMPESKSSDPIPVQIGGFFAVIAQAPWQTNIKYQADLITIGKSSIYNAEMTMRLKDDSLFFEPLAGTVKGHRIQADVHITTSHQLEEGHIQVKLTTVQRAQLAKGMEIKQSSSISEDLAIPGNVNVELSIDLTNTPVSVKTHESLSVVNEESTKQLEVSSVSIKNFTCNMLIHPHIQESLLGLQRIYPQRL